MRKFIREISSWLLSLGLALLAAMLIVTYVFQFTIVIGESMLPTLENHEALFVDKLSYQFNDPNRGDVVVCKYPENQKSGQVKESKENFIKRVVGLPGETVEIKNSVVYINGQAGQDLWMGDHKLPDMERITLDEDHYFVLGDNRSNSKDSEDQSVGPLPRKYIKGEARFVLWPFNRFGKLEKSA